MHTGTCLIPCSRSRVDEDGETADFAISVVSRVSSMVHEQEPPLQSLPIHGQIAVQQGSSRTRRLLYAHSVRG